MSISDSDKQPLFEEFPPISTEEWEKVITKDLKGADYKQKLRWRTGEGVEPLPFYRREDTENLKRSAPIPKAYQNQDANSWEIREAIYKGTVAKANEAARKALTRGANALQYKLVIRRAEGALNGDIEGIPVQDQADFSSLLDGISLIETPLHFDASLASPALLAMLWNEVQNQDLNAEEIRGTFGYDPFMYLLKHGQYPKEQSKIKKDIVDIATFTSQNLPKVRPLSIDARFYHNSGATIVQELAFALASASEYLSTLTDQNISVDNAVKTLSFHFSVGSNYFLEIAKFRAARLLWKNLLEAYNSNSEQHPAYLHGETSRWNKTVYDPYTNMLRSSTEGMSAAIAGCDALTVLPFDEHFRQPNEFSQRIARNQQLILSEESYLNKVEDPAAGSYYIEMLTNKIAKQAWSLFQDIEAEGGLFTSIEDGTIQSAIQNSQQKRNQSIATRGRTFVGTNQYTNPDDNMEEEMEKSTPVSSLCVSDDPSIQSDSDNLVQYLSDVFTQKVTIADTIETLFDVGKQQYRTVIPYRGAKEFEELRLATENHRFTPKVLNLPLGHKKWRKGRATFSSNFFGCVGYAIEDPIGYDDVSEALTSIKEEQPDIVVICSSDKEYKALVPAICDGIEQLDRQPIIVLAGYPEEDISTYKDAGVDEFIYSKCNVLETLKRFQQKLNVIEN